MFYQYSYATCFNHNFGHHQALKEHSQVIKHIGYNTDPYLLTDNCVANISWEYIYKVTIIIEQVQKIYIHKVTNMIKKAINMIKKIKNGYSIK
jgi:hypothetical protein